MPPADQSFRTRSSAWWTGASWVVLAGYVVAVVVDSGVAAAARTLPAVLLLGLLAWLVFWRPRVDLDDEGVTVVNPVRTTVVPWPALVDVRTQYALTLVTPSGQVRAFAAPGPGRHQVLTAGREEVTAQPRMAFDSRGAVAMGDLAGSPSGRVALAIRRRWEDLVETEQLELGVADETPVTRRWDAWALGAIAVLVVAVVVVAVI
jgi:hypothetical protein